MAEADSVNLQRATPLDIDSKLRSRVTEAVIAQAGIRHEALNAFLREKLAGTDVRNGALFAEPTLEAAPGYRSSGKTPRDLSGTLLHPRLVDALTNGEDDDGYRFTHPAYEHQLEAWKALSGPDCRSVLVSSGTGSGKTECFLVPLLNDLAREVEREGGRLSGVYALMLYPLNALIASQEERLRRWVRPFNGDIRFALYNGLMDDARSVDREKAIRERPEQVIHRTTLRSDPPPILVTNNTMLEYMTIRREDQPIVAASQGKLRWIVIDEAHSYVGSAAAEVALLLRRVMQVFGVAPDQVRFVATSATIGGKDEKAKSELQNYLADLASVTPAQVDVIIGRPTEVDLDASELRSDVLIREVVHKLEEGPASLSTIQALAEAGARDVRSLIQTIAAPQPSRSGPFLPVRVHKFVRAIPGLWSCLNPECSGAKPEGWPFGAILFEEEERCPHCNAPQFEVISCRECGEPWLQALDAGDALQPIFCGPDRDEFAAASARELDSEEEGEADDDAPTVEGGPKRLIATRPHKSDALIRLSIDLKTGVLPERRNDGSSVQISKIGDSDGCPGCRASQHKDRPPPLLPFRFGAPFIIQSAVPTMLEGVAAETRAREELPAGGRRLLSFTDSRQGTARFAASIETMAERGFVRAWIYHAVQKCAASTGPDPQKRAELEERLAKLTPHAGDPIFDQLIQETSAALKGAGPENPHVPWRVAVRDLADEPMVRNWIGAVWDADRDARFARNREALANFLLLRELARRPRRANSVETLGLAKLLFKPIETLRESQVPDQLRRAGCTLSDWKDFQYFLIDTVIRSYFILAIDRADQRWLLPRQSYVREIVGPDDEPRNSSDRVWPSAKGTQRRGAKSNAILALEASLGLNAANPQDRADINEILQKAWNQIRPLLEGTGSTYKLSLERADLSPVREAWLCPITNRVLPRLVFGRSPYSFREAAVRASQPLAVTFPQLPAFFPLSDASRAELAEFVEHAPEIAELRERGVWGNLHDRAATFAPYIRSEEHSAQQPPHRLRSFEADFKAGKINLLACSTTMEMGVDIGSIETVLNTNVPPSIANYRQRVGRAGRRGQGFSSSLTFARNSPLEREAFRNPVLYLSRELRAPKVKLDSARIVQRHVNALLLAKWFAEAKGELTKARAGNFFGFPRELRQDPDPAAPATQFCSWLKQPSTKQSVSKAITGLVRSTALEGAPDLLDETARMFEAAREDFGQQWKALRELARDTADAARKSIENTAKRMCGEFLLRELANRSLLPGHGFPTSVVPFITDCREVQARERQRDRDEDGGETTRNRRYNYPSRNADVAIREYAPGAEVVIDGLVWTCAGVQLNWQRPANEKASNIEDIRWFWRCEECGEAGCCRQLTNECATCGSANINSMQFLEPTGFRVDWNSEPHAETDQVRYIEPQQPCVSAHTARWEPLFDPALGRVRSTSEGVVFHHSLGASGNGYRVCLDCGRAAEDGDNALSEHSALLPPKGKAGRCSGNDKTYAITRPIALGQEILTDVAELQPTGLEHVGAAWALASALREALARRLGIEIRELGLAVARRPSALGGITHSLFFFDQASGGAGYSPRLLDDLPDLLREAREVLTCKMECQRACSACVLVPDLYSRQETIDRHTALAFLEPFIAALSNPDDDDVAAQGASFSVPVADALTRRLSPKVRVTLFAQDIPDLGALADQPFMTLFAQAQRSGSVMRLVLPPGALETLDEVQKFGLRDAAQRNFIELCTSEVPVAPNGASLIALLESANERIGWFSRDAAALQFGPTWGIGVKFPVVCAPLQAVPDIKPLRSDALERKVGPGDRVKLIKGDRKRLLSKFGVGLVEHILKDEIESLGLWKPKQLIGLRYSDRYLKAPLQMSLALQLARGLRDALALEKTRTPLSITTSPIRSDPYRAASRKIWDSWPNDKMRAEVVYALSQQFGFALEYDDTGAPHARKLVLEYDDGSKAVVLFDLGFGYWRAHNPADHDFHCDAVSQARELAASTVVVSGAGETYIAVKRS